jgi:hypothetical protein
MAYNCIICHKTVPHGVVVRQPTQSYGEFYVPTLILGGILLCSLLYDVALYLLERWTLGRTVELLLYGLLVGLPALCKGRQ